MVALKAILHVDFLHIAGGTRKVCWRQARHDVTANILYPRPDAAHGLPSRLPFAFRSEEFMPGVDDWRIDHTGIGVSDMLRSKTFYDAALGALDLRAVVNITRTFEVAHGASDGGLGGVGYGRLFRSSGSMSFTPMG
jgi:hypothetical protein